MYYMYWFSIIKENSFTSLRKVLVTKIEDSITNSILIIIYLFVLDSARQHTKHCSGAWYEKVCFNLLFLCQLMFKKYFLSLNKLKACNKITKSIVVV